MKRNHLACWIVILLPFSPALAQSPPATRNLSPAALATRAKVQNVPEIP